MINNKEDFYNYIKKDREALGIVDRHIFPFGNEIARFEKELRRGEYLLNCKPIMWRLRLIYSRLKKHKLAMKCGGYSIPYNVFGEGLAIVHWGSVVVSPGANIGKFCRIHEGVTIGATNHNAKAATIGDYVFIGSGAKIIGEISIGDNVSVGAGAVVVKDVESGITVGGVPAKKISENDSSLNL